MKVLHALLRAVSGEAHSVSGVYVGAFQTAVCAGATGLASTCLPGHSSVCQSERGVVDAGKFEGRDARELARMVLSDNPLEASIGMAAINALLPVDEARLDDSEASDFLAKRAAGKTLAVIGHFPFVDRLRPIVKTLWVIERDPLPGDLSEEEGRRVLPECDVVCVTASTLINHSFDDVMSCCRGAYVALVGPSAPLTPIVFGFGVQAVCGARVTEPPRVLRPVMQGATFRQIRRAGVKLATLVER